MWSQVLTVSSSTRKLIFTVRVFCWMFCPGSQCITSISWGKGWTWTCASELRTQKALLGWILVVVSPHEILHSTAMLMPPPPICSGTKAMERHCWRLLARECETLFGIPWVHSWTEAGACNSEYAAVTWHYVRQFNMNNVRIHLVKKIRWSRVDYTPLFSATALASQSAHHRQPGSRNSGQVYQTEHAVDGWEPVIPFIPLCFMTLAASHREGSVCNRY